MTVRRLAVAALTAVTAAGALSGCGGEGNWATKCTTTNMVVECAAAERPLVSGVTGELLDGAAYDLAADRGKVVVVNFWGSWCAPCRAEADDLEKTYQATKDSNVTFLGVNTRDDRDSAKAFERGYKVTYGSVYDFEGRVGLKFDVTQSAVPSTLILDRQGRIAAAIRRSTTNGELQPLVERIAAEAAG
ncbi:TlpA family protein disulfide reductase [Actinoplanes campanulatus]|uniref:TlpA family protein disulfide reductase n=1 Tax=Actinoplanes campanulatus TaxID=113559 RepID=UPI0016069F11|nr:TlpA disulfide reductase family protein [Actinoplanes campanulatus]